MTQTAASASVPPPPPALAARLHSEDRDLIGLGWWRKAAICAKFKGENQLEYSSSQNMYVWAIT